MTAHIRETMNKRFEYTFTEEGDRFVGELVVNIGGQTFRTSVERSISHFKSYSRFPSIDVLRDSVEDALIRDIVEVILAYVFESDL